MKDILTEYDKSENSSIILFRYSSTLINREKLPELTNGYVYKETYYDRTMFKGVIDDSTELEITLVIISLSSDKDQKLNNFLQGNVFSTSFISKQGLKDVVKVDDMSSKLKEYFKRAKGIDFINDPPEGAYISTRHFLIRCTLPIYELPTIKKNIIRYVNLYKLENSGEYPCPRILNSDKTISIANITNTKED